MKIGDTVICILSDDCISGSWCGDLTKDKILGPKSNEILIINNIDINLGLNFLKYGKYYFRSEFFKKIEPIYIKLELKKVLEKEIIIAN